MPERPALADFLRARREQLRPTDVGLPTSGRRRTPGLRREELATLAGVSIDYLVRLEQGRDTNPSASVLGALASALRLSDEERAHMFKLAAIGAHPEMCPLAAQPQPEPEVAPNVRQLLERLDPAPAFVVGPASDVLAWNTAWEMVVAPLGMLDARPPNLARYVFTHARARDAYPDWAAAAREQVSTLRATRVALGPNVHVESLVTDLQQVPEFATLWSAHSVAEKRRGVKRLVVPGAGELRLAYEVMILPDDHQRLITWHPADDATAAALDALTRGVGAGERRTRLRVVREA